MEFNERAQEFILGKLTEEDIATLKALKDSALWHLYRKVLISAKEAFSLQLLSEMETNRSFQMKGMVAGINFSINQLPAILAMDNMKKKKDEARNPLN